MDTVKQLAARRGFTWAEWRALPVSRRYEETALDSGQTVTDDMRKAWAIQDLPAGPARLAALHASLCMSDRNGDEHAADCAFINSTTFAPCNCTGA